MSASNAWLLDFGMPVRAAVGARELVQILDGAATFTVPLTPRYSRCVVVWQQRLLPVFDLARKMGAAEGERTLLAVVGYHGAPGQAVQFGALALAAPPVRIAVSDQQACPLAEQQAEWGALALSCFEHGGTPIPVLHLERIFGVLP